MGIDSNNFGTPPGPGGPQGPGGPGNPSGPGNPGQGGPGSPFNKGEGGTFSQEYRHNPVSARVPEKVARGVMSTGVLVLDSPNEFVLDFMQGLTRPFQVAARVVLTPNVMEQFAAALRDNLAKYEQRFGPPPVLPKPPTDRRPTLEEIYGEFKVPEEMASGVYANAVMVGHSPAEFFMDFITNFYPHSAVSARVFMSAAQMPRVLETVGMAVQRYRERLSGMHPPMPPMPPQQRPMPPPPQDPGPGPGPGKTNEPMM